MNNKEAVNALMAHRVRFVDDFGWDKNTIDALDFAIASLIAGSKPVVKGEWIWEEASRGYRCPACQIMLDYDKTYQLFDHGFAKFCPNCGADMRKLEV